MSLSHVLLGLHILYPVRGVEWNEQKDMGFMSN